jgi:hypothetical protein
LQDQSGSTTFPRKQWLQKNICRNFGKVF